MEGHKPLVSIIMPAYNAEKYIEEAIESVLNQTYNNWELLISDDGSKDNTMESIQKYGDEVRIKFIGQTNRLGAFPSKNHLLKYAMGEFIAFLDADDIMSEYRIERQVSYLLADDKLGMVGCQVAAINSKNEILRIHNKPTTYKEVLEQIYTNNVVGGAIMMIRKQVLENVGGGFRSYFGNLSFQDYDLSFVIAQKYKCFNLEDILYYYRQHENSISKSVNVDRILAKEVVIHLGVQRRDKGTDDLMDGNPHLVDDYFEKLKVPYKNDPSLVYREYAANFMYNQFYKRAILSSWEAIRRKPLKLVNWMTFQYCLRKSFLLKLYEK